MSESQINSAFQVVRFSLPFPSGHVARFTQPRVLSTAQLCKALVLSQFPMIEIPPNSPDLICSYRKKYLSLNLPRKQRPCPNSLEDVSGAEPSLAHPLPSAFALNLRLRLILCTYYKLDQLLHHSSFIR